jgi:alkylhydroperoxidase family enzyme
MSIFDTAGDNEVSSKQVYHQLDAIWQLRPEIGAAVANATDTVHRTSRLSARLRELVRLRIAFHNQCRTCMAVRYEPDSVPEGLVCSLEKPAEAPDLTEPERAALRFADLLATDHLAIDEAEYDRLREHFDNGQLVELGVFCALMIGLGRLTATWKVVENLPASFQEGQGLVTPWNQPETLAGIKRATR